MNNINKKKKQYSTIEEVLSSIDCQLDNLRNEISKLIKREDTLKREYLKAANEKVDKLINENKHGNLITLDVSLLKDVAYYLKVYQGILNVPF